MGQDELYQARMDYKSFFKAARFVYIPQMKEVLLVIASLGFLIGFRQHELAYELNSGGGGFVAETWSYWNYEVMFGFAKLSHAALESILILIILTIPIQIARKQAQRLSI
jgi:ABC-type sugar transport system permease subunit